MKTFLQLARDLAKPGADICDVLTPERAHLWHMATGVSGEAGELTDAIKKHVIYDRPLDRANVVEEIADVRFYLAGLMNGLDITEVEITEAINAKLSKRYASGVYTNAAANERADKAELPITGAIPVIEDEAFPLPLLHLFHHPDGTVTDAQGRKCIERGRVWVLDGARVDDLTEDRPQDRRTTYGHGDD